MCSRYLFSRLGQSIVLPRQVSSGHLQADHVYALSIEKEPSLGLVLCVFALPIFTASHPATIVGVRVLNFCVRDGNRWTHTTINTNSFPEEVLPFLYKTLLHSVPLLTATQRLFTW